MKMIQIVLIAMISILLVSCSDFVRNIRRVDGEFPLCLGFEFVKPDFAAGDTVTLRSYWSGTPKVDPSSLIWEVSWKSYEDPYGREVVLERESLEPYIVGEVVEIPANSETQIFEMRLEIPEGMIYNSPSVPEDFGELLATLGVDGSALNIPTSKVETLKLLDSIAALSSEEKGAIDRKTGYFINGLSQLYTATFRIFCDNTVAGGFNSIVDYSVRYHSLLEEVPGIFVNTPPLVTGRRVYEVAGDQKSFDPESSEIVQTFAVVNNAVSFPYKTENSYFIETDFAQRDSVITVNEAFGSQRCSFEQFYQYNSYDAEGFESISLAKQNDLPYQHRGVAQTIAKIHFDEKPVLNTPFTVRTLTRDTRIGTSYRPEAICLSELSVTLL